MSFESKNQYFLLLIFIYKVSIVYLSMIIWNNIADLYLDGGCLCFDFINTRGSWKELDSKEFLEDYFSILEFFSKQDIVPESYLEKLKGLANSDYFQSIEALNEFKTLRENLYIIFSSIASNANPPKKAINQFNLYLAKYYQRKKLLFTESNSYLINPILDAESIMEPMSFILESAVEILTNVDSKKIKECGECGWVFLDKTKNNRQKWCNPKICGARVKMRNYYQRQKQKQS